MGEELGMRVVYREKGLGRGMLTKRRASIGGV